MTKLGTESDKIPDHSLLECEIRLSEYGHQKRESRTITELWL